MTPKVPRGVPDDGDKNWSEWVTHVLPLLVLTRQGAAAVKPVLVIIFLGNNTDFPEIAVANTGAKFGENS